MAAPSVQTGIIALVVLIPWFRRAWEQCSDAAIVRLVLRGQSAAYAVLVRRYERRIYAIVRRMVRTHEDADDLAQETFVRAYQSLGTFDASRKFYTWLCRIAINLAINFTEKARRRATESLDAHAESAGLEAQESVGSRSNPSAQAEHDELSAAVEKALAALPEGMREVFILRAFDDLSYEEIAEILSVPRGTVMSRLARARGRLQTVLRPFVRDEEGRAPGE